MTDNTSVNSEDSLVDLSALSVETSSSAPSNNKSVTPIKSNETTSQSFTKTLKHKVIKSHQVIYEYPELSIMEQCAKVITFLEGGLQKGSVIFEFPRSLFAHRINVYQLIEAQLGPVVHKIFIPLPNDYPALTNTLVINTQFCDEKATNDAINKGVIINGAQYKAILYHCEFKKIRDCKKLKFTMITWLQKYNDNDLTTDIKGALSTYGKVLRISKLIVDGYFEGDFEVILESYKSPNFPSRFYVPLFGSYVESTPYI